MGRAVATFGNVDFPTQVLRPLALVMSFLTWKSGRNRDYDPFVTIFPRRLLKCTAIIRFHTANLPKIECSHFCDQYATPFFFDLACPLRLLVSQYVFHTCESARLRPV